ncbi:MAG: hypothetical protein M1833_002018 [Piccolia ochrophora]|nr:MAG: hypothetical protein M1833_002018 [Piccolia ochrophora]
MTLDAGRVPSPNTRLESRPGGKSEEHDDANDEPCKSPSSSYAREHERCQESNLKSASLVGNGSNSDRLLRKVDECSNIPLASQSDKLSDNKEPSSPLKNDARSRKVASNIGRQWGGDKRASAKGAGTRPSTNEERVSCPSIAPSHSHSCSAQPSSVVEGDHMTGRRNGKVRKMPESREDAERQPAPLMPLCNLRSSSTADHHETVALPQQPGQSSGVIAAEHFALRHVNKPLLVQPISAPSLTQQQQNSSSTRNNVAHNKAISNGPGLDAVGGHPTTESLGPVQRPAIEDLLRSVNARVYGPTPVARRGAASRDPRGKVTPASRVAPKDDPSDLRVNSNSSHLSNPIPVPASVRGRAQPFYRNTHHWQTQRGGGNRPRLYDPASATPINRGSMAYVNRIADTSSARLTTLQENHVGLSPKDTAAMFSSPENNTGLPVRSQEPKKHIANLELDGLPSSSLKHNQQDAVANQPLALEQAGSGLKHGADGNQTVGNTVHSTPTSTDGNANEPEPQLTKRITILKNLARQNGTEPEHDKPETTRKTRKYPFVYEKGGIRSRRLPSQPDPDEDTDSTQRISSSADVDKSSSGNDLAFADGSWIPAPVEWDFRKDHTDRRFDTHMERWIENTNYKETKEGFYNVDVTEVAFIDGSAHTQGSLLIDPPEHDPTLSNPEKVHNPGQTSSTAMMARHIQRLNSATKKPKRRQRIVQTEVIIPPNPYTPKIDIYVRMGSKTDAAACRLIAEFYTKTSVVRPERETVALSAIQSLIKDCETNKLPFLVAVERGPGRKTFTYDVNDKVIGFAFADDHHSRESSYRFTVDIEIFVCDEYRRLGVGKNLMDKLLSLLDPTFVQHYGCELVDPPGWGPGGKRVLKKVICEIPFAADDAPEIEWKKKFMTRFDFKERGTLEAVGLKLSKW